MKTVFTITSVINIPESIRPNLSVFDTNTRFEQTLNTIKSIKNYSQNSKIFLYETSDITKEQETIIKNEVDSLILLNEDDEMRANRFYWNKSASECLLLHKMWQDPRINEFDFIMKMTGRYEITKEFDPWYFTENNIDKVITKKRFTNGADYWFGTQLFGFGKKLLPRMVDHTLNSFNFLINLKGYIDIEHIIFSELTENQIIEVDTIGCKGYIAPLGELRYF
jgi:hypothetical protein